MNIKRTAQSYFSHLAGAASKIIALASRTSLLSPVRAVVRNLPAVPSRVILTNDFPATPDSVTSVRAKGILVALHSAFAATAERSAFNATLKQRPASIRGIVPSSIMSGSPFGVTTTIAKMLRRAFKVPLCNHDGALAETTSKEDAIKGRILPSALALANAFRLAVAVTKVQLVGFYFKRNSLNVRAAVIARNGDAGSRLRRFAALPLGFASMRTEIDGPNATFRKTDNFVASLVRAVRFDVFRGSYDKNLSGRFVSFCILTFSPEILRGK